MKISIIAGIGKKNELGKDNALLWHLPKDLQYFKKLTTGKTVIMGRKTFESIGRPLPNRRNIVVTRDPNYKKDDIEVASSLENAIMLAQTTHGRQDPKYSAGGEEVTESEHEVFVIGGAEIYKQAINLADKLYITHIDAEHEEPDAFFPDIDDKVWRETFRESYTEDEKHPANFAFVIYEK